MTTDAEHLRESLRRGRLLHPLDEAAPSVLALFRLLAGFCGVEGLPAEAGAHTLARCIEASDHIVFVLVDALGENLRRAFPRQGFLERSFVRELRSLYPSTTSVILTSQATGLWPAEHGIPGWFAYLPERDCTVVPLKMEERTTGRPAESLGIGVSDLVLAGSLAGSLRRRVLYLAPESIVDTPYARWARDGTPARGFRNLNEVRERVVEFVGEEAGAPSFASIYLPTLDSICHEKGTAAPDVARALAAIDEFLGELAERLEALLVVTADHGQVDVPADRRLRLEPGDPLLDLLHAPPAGDAANPIFHVRAGKEAEFARLLRRQAPWFWLITPEELQQLGLLGPRRLTPRARLRWGTFVGISVEPASLEYVPAGRQALDHRAVHAGLRPEEMRVGLYIG